MKATTIRLLVWTGTLAVAGVCVWQFVDFVALGGKKSRTTVSTPDDIRKNLRKTEKKAEKLRKEQQDYQVINEVNVSGVKPKAPVEVTSRPVTEEKRPDINPLDTVVGLKGVWMDNTNPGNSAATVFWKDSQISTADKAKYWVLSVGGWFPKPYEKTYRLKRVEDRKAIFEKAEGDSFVELPPITLGETRGGAFASSKPAPEKPKNWESRPGSTPIGYQAPDETKKLSEHEYLLSEKDRDEVKERGLDMIGRDVHTAPYLDPKTRQPIGLIVKSIRQDSFPQKLGIRENDIVRGVNNTAIRSTSDIYAYVKDNPDVKDVAVSVERFGRVITFTYHIP